jgi:hypothetical protein
MDDEKFFRNVDKALEHTLDKKFEEPPQFGGKPGTPVPIVDPEDMKAIAREYADIQRRYPGEAIAITARVLQPLCSPGADMQAVGYRQAQLGILKLISEQQAKADDSEIRTQLESFRTQIAPLIKDGEFTDAAFKAMARVPMEWMAAGVVREGPPYDFEEFLRLCAA